MSLIPSTNKCPVKKGEFLFLTGHFLYISKV